MSEDKTSSFLDDLEKIPCFKKTFQWSICSGIGAGLVTFLFTSRVKRSSDVAVASFALTTIGHWVYCRYHWTKDYFMTQKMNSALRNAVLKEKTSKGPDPTKQEFTSL